MNTNNSSRDGVRAHGQSHGRALLLTLPQTPGVPAVQCTLPPACSSSMQDGQNLSLAIDGVTMILQCNKASDELKTAGSHWIPLRIRTILVCVRAYLLSQWEGLCKRHIEHIDTSPRTQKERTFPPGTTNALGTGEAMTANSHCTSCIPRGAHQARS